MDKYNHKILEELLADQTAINTRQRQQIVNYWAQKEEDKTYIAYLEGKLKELLKVPCNCSIKYGKVIGEHTEFCSTPRKPQPK